MKTVILGAGLIGFQLARRLVHEGKQVLVIEQDPQKAKQISNQLDCQVVNQPGNSPAVLKDVGFEPGDCFVALTESDEVNIISCGLAQAQCKETSTIARVRNLEYTDQGLLTGLFFGIDYIINPEIETARVILRNIERGASSNILFFDEGEFQLREFVIPEDSRFIGNSVRNMRSFADGQFLIALIIRENSYLIPGGDTLLYEGDRLFILGKEEELDALFLKAKKQQPRLNKVVILGGGKTSRYVADGLLGRHEQKSTRSLLQTLGRFLHRTVRKISFIERDYQKCKELHDLYPESLVLHADISEEGFLDDTEMSGYDLLVAATGNQELNIITSMYAKKTGISRTIALVKKKGYMNIASELGVDVTVSLNNVMVNSLLRYIRRGNVRNVLSVADSPFEIIEISIDESTLIAGKQIQALQLPADCLLLLVVRNDRDMIPYGQLELLSGDRVFIISRSSDIKKIEKGILGK